MSPNKQHLNNKKLEIICPTGSHYPDGFVGLLYHIKDLIFHGNHQKQNTLISVHFDSEDKEYKISVNYKK